MGKLLAKIVRFCYRLLFKNRAFQTVALISMMIWGTLRVSEGCGNSAVLTATLMAMPPDKVQTFTIRQSNGDELIFVRQKSGWVAVKNNVSAKLSSEQVENYLEIFGGLRSLRSAGAAQLPEDNDKDATFVQVTPDSGATQAFWLQRVEKDPNTDRLFSLVALPNERVTYYVQGDLKAVLDKPFNELRNSTIFDWNPAEVTRVECWMDKRIVYKLLKNKQQNWESVNEEYVVVQPIFNEYLMQISHTSGTNFQENITFDVSNYVENQLIVTIKDSVKYTLTSYKYADQYLLQCTQNQHTFFKIDSNNVFFPDYRAFTQKKYAPPPQLPAEPATSTPPQ